MSSKELPSKAGTVIIGAGIVGTSLAYHLADQGREDIVLIDKGPFPDPGGSTGHASNFIFPIEHNKEMALLTKDAMEQYKEEDLFTNSGGIEVARTEERMEEFRRQIASSKSWGQDAEIISTEEVKEMVPYINEDIIEGGFWEPNAGVCDPLRFGEIKRKEAEEWGVLQSFANTEVTDIHVEDGAISAVETDRGTVSADEVVIAAGLWAPKLAEMAGTEIPLTPAVHQMISVGPIDVLEETGEEVGFPIVRDVDTQMYERPSGNDMEVGSYEHRPILWDVEDVPSNEEAPLSPTQPPLTQDAFDPSMEHALEIMPEILEDAEIRHAIDGLLSVTPDGMPLVGPMDDVDGLWSCAAIWIKEAPAFAKYTAQWMTQGYPEVDLHQSDVNRFEGYGTSKKFVKERAHEGFQKIYDIVHPREQWQSSRPLRQSAFYGRQEELGAEFFESAGWERPQWFESNEDLLEKYEDELDGLQRPNEWDSRWWSEIILGEHLHMRDNVGMIGDMGFGILDLVGDDVEEFTQKVMVADTSIDVGESVYTPVLAKNGGFVSDLTMARLAEDHFRVMTGGGETGPDKRWFRNNIGDLDVRIVDKTSSLATLGVWGPNARDVIQDLAEEDVSHEEFPPYTAQELTLGEVDVWAFRISYVGELGWELYAPMEQGGRLWDLIYEAGQAYDIRPVGMGVYGTTGRMEKGYRLYGHELELEYNPAEAGLTFHGVKDEDFIGKEAYAEAIEEENVATLCTLTVDDHAPEGGEPRFMTGNEPVLDQDGNVLVDEEGRRSYVTSAGTGPSLGKHLLMAYIPQEYAEEGESLQVEYMGDHYPVTVERVGSKPLFDPSNDRVLQ
ncbi:Glycine cleavage system T protein (aminomethyltransferase) [Halalkaliarchaeum sp. AArc-CO]|uniref:GcvT family protein n=1 Tax=unclassified Halalkaliarchaeum TaxID=2678344 RepID=UPI00217D40B2|nr:MULTISPECIES: FAD-dependent oxidoreductase [unclassified Halalkaliarchaeum]MDR5672054.1 FAD-dependent oxidoreductase [Halalkaliarchaeum sp. AArc-GB]UWG51552.1 Glycine cleavage system T protein (aminomethyltransferase) [Halalkaliarchaeum sp. AArc-CO]